VDDAAARALLETERAATAARLASLTADVAAIVAGADDNGDDEHDPEGATIAYERARTTALAERARADLVELDRAVARLAAGIYRRCAACGRPIGPERLAARPATRTCVACAARAPHRCRSKREQP
jgi:RNA polymerase-binding transcription factor DksA